MKKKNLYAGIDESNHGRFPEVFALILSNKEKDTQKNHFEKNRKNYSSFLKKVYRRDYSYLLLHEKLKSEIPSGKLLPQIVYSLFYPFDFSDVTKLTLYIDGLKEDKEIDSISNMFFDKFNLEESQLEIISQDYLDQNNYLVYLADGLAHYVFRKKTLESISQDKHYCPLIL
ncbi:MAG: hypothetical protein WC260_00110 [Candidatus Pacearchaeota archaeon]